MVKCPFDKKERLCIDYTDLHDYVKAFIQKIRMKGEIYHENNKQY